MIPVLGLLGFAVDASVHRTLSAEFHNALLRKPRLLPPSSNNTIMKSVGFEFDPLL